MNERNIKFLAGFYTHNQIRPKLLEQSIRHFLDATEQASAIPVVSSWEPIPDLPCRNLISHFHLRGHGHLNILLQLEQIVHSVEEEWDYFAFCEHDCLYPARYFEELTEQLSPERPRGLASENHVGLYPNGFCINTLHIQPLFAMVLRKDALRDMLNQKIGECAAKGACQLEPGDRSGWIIVPPDDPSPPIVHVNMNTTRNNHHLTNHYDYYSMADAQREQKHWGDYRKLGVFAESEIDQIIKPILPRGTYKIIEARYGDFDTGRIVDFISPLKRKQFQGMFRVTNQEAGTDPALGVVKSLRIKAVADGRTDTQVFEFREGAAFCL